MADDAISVSYPSPATVGVPVTIELTYIGEDQGGLNWTVFFDDNASGGVFDPEDAQMGDQTSGYPPVIQVQYTPTAPGTVLFNFRDDLQQFSFGYAPATLQVLSGFDPKRSSAFLGFME